jgi:hypothetical protein
MTRRFRMARLVPTETFFDVFTRSYVSAAGLSASQNINVKHGSTGCQFVKSGRRDLNPRPLEPHSSALPSCATARWSEYCLPVPRPRQTFPADRMQSRARKAAFVSSFGFVIALCAISVLGQTGGSVHLNEDAVAFAAGLIKEGHVVADGKGAWSDDRPSANQENLFIRRNGFAEYAKWHLAVDERYPENTKRRYKFPYGDFENIHRCGLLAVKARAHQYGYIEIENAAAGLERAIRVKPQIATDFHRFRNSFLFHVWKSVALTLPIRQKCIDQFW